MSPGLAFFALVRCRDLFYLLQIKTNEYSSFSKVSLKPWDLVLNYIWFSCCTHIALKSWNVCDCIIGIFIQKYNKRKDWKWKVEFWELVNVEVTNVWLMNCNTLLNVVNEEPALCKVTKKLDGLSRKNFYYVVIQKMKKKRLKDKSIYIIYFLKIKIAHIK